MGVSLLFQAGRYVVTSRALITVSFESWFPLLVTCVYLCLLMAAEVWSSFFRWIFRVPDSKGKNGTLLLRLSCLSVCLSPESILSLVS